MIYPYFTAEDISEYPDQAAFKLNQIVDRLNSLDANTADITETNE